MSSVISREVERYISERMLPGKIGIVRVTGPVANDALYEPARDLQRMAHQSREPRLRVLIGNLRRSAHRFRGVAARVYESIRRDRAKRRSYQMLASLNQSTLWDIGIGPRANIATVVEVAHSLSGHNSSGHPIVHTAVEMRRQEASNELHRRPLR
jgi:hypothetical protein